MGMGRLNEYFFYSLHVILFVSYFTFLFLELAVFSRRLLSYFSSIYNWIDISIALGFIPVMYEVYSEEDNQDNTYVNAGLCFYILLACYRAITQMRSIDSVRYLIAMIQRVFYDMLPFFTVLAFAIISLSVIEIELSKTRNAKDPRHFEATGTFVWSSMNEVY